MDDLAAGGDDDLAPLSDEDMERIDEEHRRRHSSRLPGTPIKAPAGERDASGAGGEDRSGGGRSSVQRVRRSAAAVGAGVGATTSSTSKLLRARRVSPAAFVLGLVGYAIGVNLLEGGPTQVKGWLSAKFLNKPYTPPASAAAPARLAVATSTTGPASAPVSVPSTLGAA